ncbi:MAG: DNA-3-methyladenine glycosylase family protein [Candidatus Polarisedimenticolia bacterium]
MKPARDVPRRLTTPELAAAAHRLAARDRDLAGILERHGPPPLWARPPGFDTLVRIILEQQVSLASGAAIYRRVAAGIDPFTPARCAAAGEERLRSLGVTRQKSGYIVALARSVVSGALDLDRVAALPDEGARAALVGLKGIGPWSADVYLLMALRRPDVWPAADLALLSAARRVKRLRRPPSPERVAALAEAWRPYRSVAARMLWQHYLAGNRPLMEPRDLNRRRPS